MIGVDLRLRQQFIAALESRFFFLAADARSTLRGWRPSYRNILLQIRTKLNIPCSTQLEQESGNYPALFDVVRTSSQGQATLQHELSQWKVQSKVGAQDIPSIVLKGGGVFTLSKIYQLKLPIARFKKELVKKGGQLAMINLESTAALLAAKQHVSHLMFDLFLGFLGAASRYLGFRSFVTLLGPVLWGTFLADLVIQMLGTDYARILRTIYALAQARCSIVPC
uniref:Uncharacterized protein n=1 Tax=Glycine max TaxID=3847 RepID=A0A0R0K173_SOYBN